MKRLFASPQSVARSAYAILSIMKPTPIEEVKRDAETLSSLWKRSRGEPAGRRFRALLRLRQGRGRSTPSWLSALHYVVGSVLVALGLVFTFIPGPNWFFLIPGAVILATESRAAAVGLDAFERLAEPAIRVARRIARRMHPAARWAVLLLCFAVAFWVAWRLVA